MTNAIEKLNTIAIASIEAVNGITDANLQALNGLEFTAGYSALSWATATAISTGSTNMCSGGTTSSGLVFGGDEGGSLIGSSQEWDGSSWAGGGSLSTTREIHGGGGTQTSAVCMGGYAGGDETTSTEEYTGTSWGSGGNMQKGSYGPVSFGASITSHVWHGGKKYGGDAEGYMDDVETYDGSTWSTANNASIGMEGRAACFGIEGAGVKAGGNSSGSAAITTCETFDGSNWSSANALNTARAWVSGFGLDARGWVTGGYDASSGSRVSLATIETWDGTSFSADTNMPKNLARTSRGQYVGAGRAGFQVGGDERDSAGSGGTAASTHYQAS
jgi:hypothetical protein